MNTNSYSSRSRRPVRACLARRFASGSAAALLCLGLVAGTLRAGSFSEPYTVFYGKVTGTGSAQPFLIDSGQLSWTILRADGTPLTLTTALFAFHDNTFSYRLHVPHSAFALGLETDPDGVPMPPLPQTHLHAAVTVDGEPAVLLGPASAAFTTEQLLRTAAYRLDLGVAREATDTDGDGIPDWWEDLYGLDKQDPTDAHNDLSGDGITALQAYLRGLDPTRDSRQPALLTRELIVYPAGATALALDTSDLDSGPEQIVYTLTRAPHAGRLILRNAQADPQAPDATLSAGSVFTQADVLRGRLLYERSGPAADPGSFDVEVRDENPDHAVDTGTIRLLAYEPGDVVPEMLPESEARRLDNHSYAKRGFVIFDLSPLAKPAHAGAPSAGLAGEELAAYLDDFGVDRNYALIAPANVSAAGGLGDDVLIADDGGDVFLAGGVGANRFVFRDFAAGQATIADFNPDEDDTLDFSRLPAESGAFAHRYLSLAATDDGYVLRTDLSGAGLGYTNLTVALPGLDPAWADLYRLIETGRLEVGALRLEPEITVVASLPIAEQNGPTEGRFTLHRRGCLLQPLTVGIGMSGSAVNGMHYEHVPAAIVLPAGVASADVAIRPYTTGLEWAVVAQLTVAPGDGYRPVQPLSASVTIEPLMMVVEIEALEPVVVKDQPAPYAIRIRRRFVTQGDALVRLGVDGTAASGSDYDAINPFVYLSSGVANAFLEIAPRPDADFSAGARTVAVSILADDDYLIKPGAGSAYVALIERLDSFAAWREREFAGSEGDSVDFAHADSGGTGVSHFQRYVFGLDPHRPDPDDLPRVFLHQGRMIVTFRKPLTVRDVIYRVTGLGSLTDPAGSAMPMTPVPAPDGSNDPERVYYRAEPENARQGFAIVEAEWTP